jgi:uncharacterized protein with beta-barrel porin domain
LEFNEKKTGIPKISVDTLTLSTQESVPIRVVAGTASGLYQNVLQVENNASRQKLLTILRSGGTALYQPTWTENGKSLDLRLSILTINDYINTVWGKSGGNIENIGELIENVSTRYPALRERLEGLNDTQLRNVLLRAMAGELMGDAARFSIPQPAHFVFRYLDNAASLHSPFTRKSTRGQVRDGYNVWFNAFGQGEQAEKDGNTFDGYDISRYGFHIGGDIELYRQAVAGILFGYASPHVKSDLGKISANDYTAGLYLRLPLYRELFLNSMVGFGNQDFSYKGIASNAHFRGNSYYANVELLRPIPVFACRLTPLVAVDFQTVDMNEITIHDPEIDVNFRITPGNLNSTGIRVGLLGEVWRFRTRVQYVNQVAGNDFVSSRTSILGDELGAAARIRGTQWGRDWLNAGIGGELLTTQHWRIFADYNFDMGKRTTSHLGSINSVFRW